MKTCLCDISALEILRAMNASSLGAVSMGRMGLLRDCGAPGDIVKGSPFADVVSAPVHYLVLHDGPCRYRRDETGVRHTTSLLSRSPLLFQLGDGLSITGPELIFARVARSLQEESDDSAAALIRLACLGFELCGRYALAPTDTEGFSLREEPLTSVERIDHVLDQLVGLRGAGLARRALPLVQDGARSPMEAALELLLCAPRRLGGMGFVGGRVNYRLATADGKKEVDLAFPDEGFGLEYQGRAYHAAEAVRREDRRRNALAGSGITILPIWYEDLAYIDRFNRLVSVVAHLLGVRVRIRSEAFTQKQRVLRSLVLPNVKRFDV